jgi:hypothetical protein
MRAIAKLLIDSADDTLVAVPALTVTAVTTEMVAIGNGGNGSIAGGPDDAGIIGGIGRKNSGNQGNGLALFESGGGLI